MAEGWRLVVEFGASYWQWIDVLFDLNYVVKLIILYLNPIIDLKGIIEASVATPITDG